MRIGWAPTLDAAAELVASWARPGDTVLTLGAGDVDRAAAPAGAARVKIDEAVELSRYTTLGTGGPARGFARPETSEEVAELLHWAAARGLAVAVVGLGSNLLAADAGVDSLVLKLGGELARVEVDGDVIRAGAGAANAVCLHRARDAGLGGFEFACAIPGTIGGGVWMNAGAYGSDFSSVLERALVATAEGSGWLTPAELGLSYRHSELRHGQVVLRAELRLSPRPTEEIRADVRELNARRKDAQPTNKRTFGSVFKNPDHELSAGRMLDACGLRVTSLAARVSPRSTRTSSRTRAARRRRMRSRSWPRRGAVPMSSSASCSSTRSSSSARLACPTCRSFIAQRRSSEGAREGCCLPISGLVGRFLSNAACCERSSRLAVPS